MRRAKAMSRPYATADDGTRIGWARSAFGRDRRTRLSRRSLATLVSLAVLGAAAVHPARGLGVPLCMLKLHFGIDCPGCGITRSLSCSVRGMWQDAWQYNPFGLPLLGVLVAVVLHGFVPGTFARRLSALRARHARIERFGVSFVAAAFLGYGAVRAVIHFMAEDSGAVAGLFTRALFH